MVVSAVAALMARMLNGCRSIGQAPFAQADPGQRSERRGGEQQAGGIAHLAAISSRRCPPRFAGAYIAGVICC